MKTNIGFKKSKLRFYFILFISLCLVWPSTSEKCYSKEKALKQGKTANKKSGKRKFGNVTVNQDEQGDQGGAVIIKYIGGPNRPAINSIKPVIVPPSSTQSGLLNVDDAGIKKDPSTVNDTSQEAINDSESDQNKGSAPEIRYGHEVNPVETRTNSHVFVNQLPSVPRSDQQPQAQVQIPSNNGTFSPSTPSAPAITADKIISNGVPLGDPDSLLIFKPLDRNSVPSPDPLEFPKFASASNYSLFDISPKSTAQPPFIITFHSPISQLLHYVNGAWVEEVDITNDSDGATVILQSLSPLAAITIPPGTRYGRCLGNGTCNGSLECRKEHIYRNGSFTNRCVRADECSHTDTSTYANPQCVGRLSPYSLITRCGSRLRDGAVSCTVVELFYCANDADCIAPGGLGPYVPGTVKCCPGARNENICRYGNCCTNSDCPNGRTCRYEYDPSPSYQCTSTPPPVNVVPPTQEERARAEQARQEEQAREATRRAEQARLAAERAAIVAQEAQAQVDTTMVCGETHPSCNGACPSPGLICRQINGDHCECRRRLSQLPTSPPPNSNPLENPSFRAPPGRLPDGTVGVPYSFQFPEVQSHARKTVGPISYLPGLSISEEETRPGYYIQTLSGTPRETYGGAPLYGYEFYIGPGELPTIYTGPLPVGSVGNTYEYVFLGGSPGTGMRNNFSLIGGRLPPGLTLENGYRITGTIEAEADANMVYHPMTYYDFQIRNTDSNNNTVDGNFQIRVDLNRDQVVARGLNPYGCTSSTECDDCKICDDYRCIVPINNCTDDSACTAHSNGVCNKTNIRNCQCEYSSSLPGEPPPVDPPPSLPLPGEPPPVNPPPSLPLPGEPPPVDPPPSLPLPGDPPPAVGLPPPANSVCGNGTKESPEQCDDGNTTDSDGCNSACTVEGVTSPFCGNGIINGTSEECDDNNFTDGDGCSSTCKIESAPPSTETQSTIIEQSSDEPAVDEPTLEPPSPPTSCTPISSSLISANGGLESVTVYELTTGSPPSYVVDPTDDPTVDPPSFTTSYSIYDPLETYNVFLSKADGTRDNNGSYITIDCSVHPDWLSDFTGNNIDAVQLNFKNGLVYAGFVSPGTGTENNSNNIKALDEPDGGYTNLGNGKSSITLGFCVEASPLLPTITEQSSVIEPVIDEPAVEPPSLANSVCGNGIKESPEECDDGNITDGDCCSSICTINTFSSPVSYAVGSQPFGVTTADFDGVNGLDLAVVNNGGNDVSVLLNNGNGTFTTTNYDVGQTPYEITTGDFNGDGKPDLATANYNGGADDGVSVLLNNGDGIFKPAIGYSLEGVPTPFGITAGDFGGDSKSDLAVTSLGSASVSVFISKASGGFNSPITYPTGSISYAVTAGDLDGDGDLDLATANYNGDADNGVSVLLNNGDGTFASAVNYDTDHYNLEIEAGDLDGDGDLDLAVTSSDGGVSVLLNNGNGTFASAVLYSGTGATYSIAIADFDMDGKKDIVGPAFNITLAVDGTLNYKSSSASLSGSGIVAGDFNRDGKLDLADSSVSVFLGCNESTADEPVVEPPPPANLVCGNNILEDGEKCDDGNTIDGDGCSSTCTTEDLCGIPDIYLSTDDGATEEKLIGSPTEESGPLPKSDKVITYVIDGKCPSALPCPDCVKKYYENESDGGCDPKSLSENDIKNCIFFQLPKLTNSEPLSETSDETPSEPSASLGFRTKFDKKYEVKELIQKNFKAVIAYTENNLLPVPERNRMTNKWPGWDAATGTSTRNLYFAATRQGTPSYAYSPPPFLVINRVGTNGGIRFQSSIMADQSEFETTPAIALMDFQRFDGAGFTNIAISRNPYTGPGGTGSLSVTLRLSGHEDITIRPFNHANFISYFTFALFSKLNTTASLTAAFDAISEDDYWRDFETRAVGQRTDRLRDNANGSQTQSPRRSPWDINAWVKNDMSNFEIHRILVLIPGENRGDLFTSRQNMRYVKARLMSEYPNLFPEGNVFPLNAVNAAPPVSEAALIMDVFEPVAMLANDIKTMNAAARIDDVTVLPAKVEVLFYYTGHSWYQKEANDPYNVVPEVGTTLTAAANFTPPNNSERSHQGGLNAFYWFGGTWPEYRTWGNELRKGMLESDLKRLIGQYWQKDDRSADDKVDVVFEVHEGCNSFAGGI